MLNNAPLPDASVLVHYPDKSTATGRTDAKGAFSLVFSNGKPGASPGTALKVSVHKTNEPTTTVAPGGESMDPSQMMKMGQAALEKRKTADGKVMPDIPKSVLPPKYSNPDSSGITVDIPPEGKKDLKIDLST